LKSADSPRLSTCLQGAGAVTDDPGDNLRACQRVVAHHEAGHAWAAASRSRHVFEIDITHEDDEYPEAATTTDIINPDDADYGFLAYGGPWASAQFCAGSATISDIDTVWLWVRNNSHTDWPMLQEALGRRNLTTADKEMAFAHGLRGDSGAPAGELRPNKSTTHCWHRELETLRHKITDLAHLMLNGSPTLRLTETNVLVQVAPTVWRRPGWPPSR